MIIFIAISKFGGYSKPPLQTEYYLLSGNICCTPSCPEGSTVSFRQDTNKKPVFSHFFVGMGMEHYSGFLCSFYCLVWRMEIHQAWQGNIFFRLWFVFNTLLYQCFWNIECKKRSMHTYLWVTKWAAVKLHRWITTTLLLPVTICTGSTSRQNCSLWGWWNTRPKYWGSRSIWIQSVHIQTLYHMPILHQPKFYFILFLLRGGGVGQLIGNSWIWRVGSKYSRYITGLFWL